MIYMKLKNKKKNEKLEQYIFFLIFIEHILSLVVTIFFFDKSLGPTFCWGLITISGAMNFIFNDFYAINTVQYLSLSGFISSIQLIFRSLEIVYSNYKNDYWIILQYAVSIIGIITFCDYKYKILEKICSCRKHE